MDDQFEKDDMRMEEMMWLQASAIKELPRSIEEKYEKKYEENLKIDKFLEEIMNGALVASDEEDEDGGI